MKEHIWDLSTRDLLRGRAGDSPSPLGRESFVAGTVSSSPPFKLNLRAYLENELFGYFLPTGSNGSMTRPQLRGFIECRGAESCALRYRIDGFWIAVALLIFGLTSLILIVLGILLLVIGGSALGLVPEAMVVLGILMGFFFLSIGVKLHSAMDHEKFLMGWVLSLDGLNRT